MKNISFDNPYLLLLAIPIILLIVIPYIISVNKDNRSAGWRISMGLHIVIGLLVTMAIAGLMSVTVLTKTTVYVVADVSYSSERNLDEIDEYIQEVKESLPPNSQMGVVCFGKNVVMLTPAGRTIKSVSESGVDDTATDIVGALNYTETLFESGTIKRIVLITDGNDTVSKNEGSLASTVERLTDNGIKIDAVYLDNSLKENESEVQMSDVEYTPSTYVGHKTSAKFLLQASKDTNARVELYARKKANGSADFKLVEKQTVMLEEGFNSVTMELPTDIADSYEYQVTVVAENDRSPHNNTRTFVQTVVGKMQILLVTGKAEDAALMAQVYGEDAEIDARIIGGVNSSIPFTIEELAVYDEIIISNVDIRDIRNINAFMNSLDAVISQFGKSLIAYGDLGLQDDIKDPVLIKFQELLPVKYGNESRDGKLYTIVLDVSHSMYMAYKLRDACDVANKLLGLLNDEDYVCLVTFSGEVSVRTPSLVGDCKEELSAYISSFWEEGKTDHGTDIGVGLEEALKQIKALNLRENQVMIISDGNSFDSTVDSIEISTELFQSGTPISAVAVYTFADEDGMANLRNIVSCGEGGIYAQVQAGAQPTSDVVFGTVADSVTEAVILRDSSINLVRRKDAVLSGINSLPSVSGYIQSMAKYDATVALTVNYVKLNGYKTTVPLYAYRDHGNGRVCSFTSDLSGEWTENWSDEVKAQFIKNIFVSNTPKENLDNPYTVAVDTDGFDTRIELTPSVIAPSSVAKVKISLPDGRVITRQLTFDSQKYYYEFDSSALGAYNLYITYTYSDKDYISDIDFERAYLPEHDAFTSFDKAKVYSFMRNYGSISEGEIPSLENDANEVSTYKISYAVPLLIAAMALFILDILVRKLRLSDRATKRSKKQKKGDSAI